MTDPKKGKARFKDWYPVAALLVRKYAPEELGMANALADLLANVSNGTITPAEAEIKLREANR